MAIRDLFDRLLRRHRPSEDQPQRTEEEEYKDERQRELLKKHEERDDPDKDRYDRNV